MKRVVVKWTEETDARLIKLWDAKKLSTAEIGEAIGRSKNSVVGRAHRLGLEPKVPGGSRPGRVRKAAAKTVAPPEAEKRPGKPFVFKPPQVERKPGAYVPPTQIWHGDGVPLLEAVQGQCKAIMGSSDDARGLAVYCGRPVKQGTTLSFCQEHYVRYTTSSYWSR